MSFLADLVHVLAAEHPDWTAALDVDQGSLVVTQGGVTGMPLRFLLRAEADAIVLEDLWRIPLKAGAEQDAQDLLLSFLREAAENRGWQVPVVLLGGPREGRRLTKPWEDLVGRLVFARKVGQDGRDAEAHIYKWHLRKSDAGDYVCVYERSLAGAEVDEFIARGVESTGPFVLIRDA